jgi:WD40 repeat protein
MSCISRPLASLIFLVFPILAGISQVRADDFRKWTDSTGQFNLRAKFDSAENGKVTLVRENGSKLTIALEKLSKADQEYVAEQNSENPFQVMEDNPFEPPQAKKERSGNVPRVVSVDWSQSQLIPLEASDSAWQVTPPDVAASNFRPRSVPLPPKKEFFEKMSGLAVSRTAKAAVVGYMLDRPFENLNITRLILCDLQGGRVTASASAKGLMAPIALHDDGQQILMRHNGFGFGVKDQLEIWILKGKEAVRTLIFTPYDEIDETNRDVTWAEFIDAKTLATCSSGGKAAIWSFPALQPICHFQLFDSSIPALSPDRKWIAFASGNTVGLFDIEKRKVIARQKTPHNLTWTVMAFSPSGRKIGCEVGGHILIWDTASGRMEKDISLPQKMCGGGIIFPDEDFILAHNQYLIEIEHQLKLWHYQGEEPAGDLDLGCVHTVGGTTFFVADSDDTPGMLISAKVPHPEVLSFLKKTLQHPETFAFHKGTPVRLDVSGIPEEQKKDVTEALTKKLRDMKCPIKESGDVDVVAYIDGPKPVWGSKIPASPLDWQALVSHLDWLVYDICLKIVYQGKTAWEMNLDTKMSIIKRKNGESVAGTNSKVDVQALHRFYEQVSLPELVQKPPPTQGPIENLTLGTSKVTPKGFR